MNIIKQELLDRKDVKKFLDKQKLLVEKKPCHWCKQRVDLTNNAITVQILSWAVGGEDISKYSNQEVFHGSPVEGCDGWSEFRRWTANDNSEFAVFVSELTSGELVREESGRWTFKTK